jgi:hypothetical protein
MVNAQFALLQAVRSATNSTSESGLCSLKTRLAIALTPMTHPPSFSSDALPLGRQSSKTARI